MSKIAKPSIACWICGEPVSLERCVVDEHGMAVHEACSVAKITARAKPPMRQSLSPRGIRQGQFKN
jgi:hypothetical protein